MMRNQIVGPRLGLLLALFLSGAAGCSDAPDTPVSEPRMSPTPTGGEAIYGLNVDLSYADDRAQLPEEAMVYVFLRTPGKRMPLAVQHFSARELPHTVSFAGAGNEAVELVARLSVSGRVDRSPGDVEVVERLPGLRPPPQTLTLVLGDVGTGVAPGVDTAEESRPASVVKTAVSIVSGHPFEENAVVFVIARKPGQVMPSAVRRLSVSDLPADIELSDADSMTFSNRLSEAPALDLFARVSTSGTTSRSSTDWMSDVVRVETRNLSQAVALVLEAP
jgi:hypothetical protein